ncbi:MAG TPA: hypothetical protein ENI59_01565 [Euryarchaeota archaeon]|nr:hypothetical protein [Euryarchaeota archaeon]
MVEVIFIYPECRDDRKRSVEVYLPVSWLREFDSANHGIEVAGDELNSTWGHYIPDKFDGMKRMQRLGLHYPESDKEKAEVEQTKEEIKKAVEYLKERKTYPRMVTGCIIE